MSYRQIWSSISLNYFCLKDKDFSICHRSDCTSSVAIHWNSHWGSRFLRHIVKTFITWMALREWRPMPRPIVHSHAPQMIPFPKLGSCSSDFCVFISFTSNLPVTLLNFFKPKVASSYWQFFYDQQSKTQTNSVFLWQKRSNKFLQFKSFFFFVNHQNSCQLVFCQPINRLILLALENKYLKNSKRNVSSWDRIVSKA